MKKNYNEFNEEERKAIDDLDDAWLCAECSDDYRVTLREEDELLKGFNERFGYNFRNFCCSGFAQNHEECWFN